VRSRSRRTSPPSDPRCCSAIRPIRSCRGRSRWLPLALRSRKRPVEGQRRTPSSHREAVEGGCVPGARARVAAFVKSWQRAASGRAREPGGDPSAFGMPARRRSTELVRVGRWGCAVARPGQAGRPPVSSPWFSRRGSCAGRRRAAARARAASARWQVRAWPAPGLRPHCPRPRGRPAQGPAGPRRGYGRTASWSRRLQQWWSRPLLAEGGGLRSRRRRPPVVGPREGRAGRGSAAADRRA
jgi:hypothetical protein